MGKRKLSADEYGPYGQLVELLIEYTSKLRTLMDRPDRPGGRIASTREKVSSRFEEALMELSEFASQKIEYSGIDDITRLEIKLRLAEFETVLQDYRNIR